MKEITFSGVVGVIGGVFSYLFGGWDVALATLCLFLSVDYIMGFVIAGVLKKSPKSESGALVSGAGREGLFKKGVTLLIVLVAVQLDKVVGSTFIRNMVVMAFISNELLSIVENAGIMGVPIPSGITQAIEILKNKGNDDD